MNHRRVGFVSLLLALLLVAAASSGYGDMPFEQLGVRVAKTHDLELKQLVSVPELTPGRCATVDETSTCTIPADLELKWGAGFCEDDRVTLAKKVTGTIVELRVAGLVVPRELIHERDEDYDRAYRPYCHTWLVKLWKWKPGATVVLSVRMLQFGVEQYRELLAVKVETVNARPPNNAVKSLAMLTRTGNPLRRLPAAYRER